MLTKFLDWAAEPPKRPRPKRARTPLELGLAALTIFLGTLLGGQTVLAGISEGDCWIWPGIGTRFAPGYTAWGFAAVQPGMTKAEVVRLIGQPLSAGFFGTAPTAQAGWQRGDEVWQYGTDSSALGGDWAWLSREVVFRGGVVVQTVYWTYHD